MSILGSQSVDYKANDLLADGVHTFVVRKATPASSADSWPIGTVLVYDEGVATLTGSTGVITTAQTLILSVNGGANDTATFETADFVDITDPTVAEIKLVIETDISGVLVTDLGSGDFTITTTATGTEVSLQRTGGTVTTLSIGTDLVYGVGTMEVSEWDGTDATCDAIMGVLATQADFTLTTAQTVRIVVAGALNAARILPTKATVIAAGGSVGMMEKALAKLGMNLKGARV